MPIQIDVNEQHAKPLIDFYVQRLKILRAEIVEREKETKEINTTILKLKNGYKAPQQVLVTSLGMGFGRPYLAAWPWVKKIQFAIEQAGKPVTTKEIVDILADYEADFIFDRKRAIASISSVLSTKYGADKEFLRVDSESGDFAYEKNPNYVKITLTTSNGQELELGNDDDDIIG